MGTSTGDTEHSAQLNSHEIQLYDHKRTILSWLTLMQEMTKKWGKGGSITLYQKSDIRIWITRSIDGMKRCHPDHFPVSADQPFTGVWRYD